MKRCMIAFVIFATSFPLSMPATQTAHAIRIERGDPAYAKWGKLAVLKTKEKYPQADVIDYLYVGREKKSSGVAVEKFKLWLRQNEREFGVFVDIEFDLPGENIIQITFKESPI
ncbi:DUF3889 domain-containing protein [Ectobacillus panaciterrae]|uniref:DUF3889 domain-containing protein n=1 Tax=Ectobacillus panaciterrae TaxID=363872 RepID=UPI000553F87F|nr:DUF3889 domain-containing protein [Ectobacillus panaciterrae]